MKPRIILLVIVGIFLVVAVVVGALYFISAPDTTCNVIHKPVGGCPPHWVTEPGVFIERDGSLEDACVAPPEEQHEECTDYLSPGEGQHSKVIIPRAPKKPEPKT
jgi:hypothetical protein